MAWKPACVGERHKSQGMWGQEGRCTEKAVGSPNPMYKQMNVVRERGSVGEFLGLSGLSARLSMCAAPSTASRKG